MTLKVTFRLAPAAHIWAVISVACSEWTWSAGCLRRIRAFSCFATCAWGNAAAAAAAEAIRQLTKVRSTRERLKGFARFEESVILFSSFLIGGAAARAPSQTWEAKEKRRFALSAACSSHQSLHRSNKRKLDKGSRRVVFHETRSA